MSIYIYIYKNKNNDNDDNTNGCLPVLKGAYIIAVIVSTFTICTAKCYRLLLLLVLFLIPAIKTTFYKIPSLITERILRKIKEDVHFFFL